jgi:hypothetical protein
LQQHLFDAGVEHVLVGKHPKYYECLYKLRGKSYVAPDQKVSAYIGLLEDESPVEPEEDSDDAPMGGLGGAHLDADEPHAALDAVAPRAAPRAAPAPSPGGASLDGLLWNASASCGDGLGEPDGSSDSSSSSSSSSSDSSSSSSSSSKSDGPEGALDRLARVGPVAPPLSLSDWPTVEGVNVKYESHGEPGDSDHYKRIIVVCKHFSHLGHKECVRKRNVGVRQTAAFGQFEPLAFVGVWLREGHRFPSQIAHNGFTPSLQEIEAYMILHGMPGV